MSDSNSLLYTALKAHLDTECIFLYKLLCNCNHEVDQWEPRLILYQRGQMWCFDLNGLADTSTTLDTIQGVCSLWMKNVGYEVLCICFHLPGVVMAMLSRVNRFKPDFWLAVKKSVKRDKTVPYLGVDRRILAKILCELWVVLQKHDLVRNSWVASRAVNKALVKACETLVFVKCSLLNAASFCCWCLPWM